MNFIATGNLAWIRAHLRGDSGSQVFIEERERPFAILCKESSITIKYEDFGSQYCLHSLESRLETWNTWISRPVKFVDSINFIVYKFVSSYSFFSL